ncbi:single-stranded-DNA-specific exonuclease RecJ [Candidatus Saccharibacteria bacterium]|nr:single-stranded-DNA-specific exonuclease RecJ [Candidatus Saccharibacteria bacterium]
MDNSSIWQKPNAIIANRDDLLPTILQKRGLKGDEQKRFLSPDYQADLGDPFLMKDMQKAVDRIIAATADKQKIVIYGDYDIDGLTASTLLYDVLHKLNPRVEVYIPDRFEEGYGLNSAALKKLHADKTDLVITVDCGITSAVEVSEAAKLGLDIIITDHHTLPEELPDKAIGVINPKQPDDKYPYKELAGVGVAFNLTRALQRQRPDWLPVGYEKWLLDLVALGTVCDVVDLTGENRVLVHYGLMVLRKSKRAGIKALSEAAGVELSQIKTDDLGFRLGPRLNAAGRLEHAKKSLKLLLCTDIVQANQIAQSLNQLNSERQTQTAQAFEQASEVAKEYVEDQVLVLANPDWSHGIAGLVASRISERYHRPTIILQILGEEAKGSARSFGKCNIIEAIAACGKDLIKFGGHAFAAGLTLPTSKIDEFRQQINDFVQKQYSKDDFLHQLDIDCVLSGDLLVLESLSELKKLEPHGNANPPPMFVSQLYLEEAKFIGQDRNHTKFRFRTNSRRFLDGISFNSAHRWPDGIKPSPIEVVYRLSENVWQNVAQLQLEVVDICSLDRKS